MRSMLVMAVSALTAFAGGTGTVMAKGQAFQAEIAATDAEKAQGLMRRSSLAQDACMIFLYDTDGPRSIWMKNCLIALDVAWTDAEGRIVELVPNVPPPSPLRTYASDGEYPTYGGTVPCRVFVEFAAGTFKRLALKKGDRLGWKLKLANGSVLTGGAAGKGKP